MEAPTIGSVASFAAKSNLPNSSIIKRTALNAKPIIRINPGKRQDSPDTIALMNPHSEIITDLTEASHPLLSPWVGRHLTISGKHNGIDFVGDVHGCCDELEALMTKLGYAVSWKVQGSERLPTVSAPEGRTLVLLGDLVDRGPRVVDTLRLAAAIVTAKLGYAIMGNHDLRLLRFLTGFAVQQRSGLSGSIRQLYAGDQAADISSIITFLKTLPSRITFVDSDILASHTGLDSLESAQKDGEADIEAIRGKTVKKNADLSLDFSTETGEDQLHESREHWADLTASEMTVVYGHYQVKEANWIRKAICLDTGCVHGGKLTSLRWPELTIESVESAKVYYPSNRTSQTIPSGELFFETPATQIFLPLENEDLTDIAEYI